MRGDRGGYPGFLDSIGGCSDIPSLNPNRKRGFQDVGWIKKVSDWSDSSQKTWLKMWKISVELWGGLEVVSTCSGIDSTTTLELISTNVASQLYMGASPDDFCNCIWNFIYPNRMLPWYCIYLFIHFYSFQYMFQFNFTFIYRMFHHFFVHFCGLSRILHSIKTL